MYSLGSNFDCVGTSKLIAVLETSTTTCHSLCLGILASAEDKRRLKIRY